MIRKNSKKELAETLYMSGINQQDIAEKIGISRQTVNKWCITGAWKEKRGAKTITRQELINKILISINTALNDCDADPKKYGAMSDRLVKLASTIDKLDKKGNIVDAINTFIEFGDFLEKRSAVDKDVTSLFIKKVTDLQDMFINEKF